MRAGGHVGVSDGRKSGPELCDEDQNIKDEADPGADDAGLGFECQLVEGVAVVFPGLAEADVAGADAGPGDDGGEAGDGEHPVERLGPRGWASGDDEAEQSGGRSENDGEKRLAGDVDISEDFGGLAAIGEGSGGAVDGTVAHRKHSDENHGIHDGRDGSDLGVFHGDDEGGGVGVTA